MTDLLIWFLLGELALLILWGLLKPTRVYQFPFLAGCVFALWSWPQFYGLHASASAPDRMLNKALIMTILCSGMCYFGYETGRRPITKFNWALNRRRLTYAAVVLTLLGVAFQYKVSRISESVVGGQSTGLPVVYMFFAKLLCFGFGIAVFVLVRRFTFSALIPVAIGGFGYLDWIVFCGRRQAAIQFFLIIAMLVWFIRKKMPPRAVIAGGILLGAFLSYNIGVYRSAMSHGSLFSSVSGANVSDLKRMSATDPLKRVTTEGGGEMRNAAYYIAATEDLSAYDFGLYQVSMLVFAYFPAQVFGRTAKDNLMSLGGLVHIGNNAFVAYGYEGGVGTTVGGITDAFASFWYFGCLEFFVIGYYMRRVYESAVRGSPVWQIVCALMTVFALHAITHSTSWFVWPWVHAAAFLGPGLLYARARPGEPSSETISPSPMKGRLRPPELAVLPASHQPGDSPMEQRAMPPLRRFNARRLKFVKFPSRRLRK